MRGVQTVIPLDQPNEAAAFVVDPYAALSGLRETVLLDEWQAVPSILGAIKRTVDSDPRPRRFILTGSVQAEHSGETWPGTGRQERGRREVDLIIEIGGGRFIAVEAKATSAPTVGDAHHLAWLRDQLGAAFVAGIVMHTGPRSYPLGDRISAMPIATFWGTHAAHGGADVRAQPTP